jgi:hypothetical protein
LIHLWVKNILKSNHNYILKHALNKDNDDIKKIDNIRNFNPFGSSNEKLVLDPANKWPKGLKKKTNLSMGIWKEE